MKIGNYPIISTLIRSISDLEKYPIQAIIGTDFAISKDMLIRPSHYNLTSKIENNILINYNQQDKIEVIKNKLRTVSKDGFLYVDFSGYDILPMNPLDYSDEPNDDLFKVKLSFGERNIGDLIKNNFRYKADYKRGIYYAISDDEARKNYNKLRIRKDLIHKIGDSYDLISDNSALIQAILISQKDNLPLEIKNLVDKYLANSIDLEKLERALIRVSIANRIKNK